MHASFNMKQNAMSIRKQSVPFFLALVVLWGLVAIDVLPASAETPPETVPEGNIYLPIVNNSCPLRRDMRTPTVFGVQMYTDTGRTGNYFHDMMATGTSWVRVEAPWSLTEPTNTSPDQFRWDYLDRALAASAYGGINIIGTINHNPAWAANRSTGPINSEHLADFGEFVTAVVERYDGDGFQDDPCGRVVRHWEFYNEPDGNEGRWGNDGDKYAQMLSVAYPAVQQASAEAKVLFGGIAYDWFEDQNGPFVRSFFTDVLDAGGGAYFDIMNYHVYPAFAPNWTNKGPGLVEKTEAIREVLADYGLDKPLMITESGAHSNNDPGSPATPQTQASYVVELFTQSLAADVDVMIWFMLYDPPEWYPHRNGLVTTDTPPVRKPAFFTFQQSVDQLGRASFDRELTDAEMGDPDMLAYRFIQPDGDALYVAWISPVMSERTAPLKVNGAEAVVHDIFTNRVTVRDGDDGQTDGKITVTVSKEPLLIEIKS